MNHHKSRIICAADACWTVEKATEYKQSKYVFRWLVVLILLKFRLMLGKWESRISHCPHVKCPRVKPTDRTERHCLDGVWQSKLRVSKRKKPYFSFSAYLRNVHLENGSEETTLGLKTGRRKKNINNCAMRVIAENVNDCKL